MIFVIAEMLSLGVLGMQILSETGRVMSEITYNPDGRDGDR